MEKKHYKLCVWVGFAWIYLSVIPALKLIWVNFWCTETYYCILRTRKHRIFQRLSVRYEFKHFSKKLYNRLLKWSIVFIHYLNETDAKFSRTKKQKLKLLLILQKKIAFYLYPHHFGKQHAKYPIFWRNYTFFHPITKKKILRAPNPTFLYWMFIIKTHHHICCVTESELEIINGQKFFTKQNLKIGSAV